MVMILTLGILLAAVNASIVLISLPAIFRGIGLNPLAPGNVSYLLWMLMGYLVVTAVQEGRDAAVSMARALRVPSWGTGLLVLVPAACDLYRYFVPDSRWAPWVSLGGKLTMVGAAAAF